MLIPVHFKIVKWDNFNISQIMTDLRFHSVTSPPALACFEHNTQSNLLKTLVFLVTILRSTHLTTYHSNIGVKGLLLCWN